MKLSKQTLSRIFPLRMRDIILIKKTELVLYFVVVTLWIQTDWLLDNLIQKRHEETNICHGCMTA